MQISLRLMRARVEPAAPLSNARPLAKGSRRAALVTITRRNAGQVYVKPGGALLVAESEFSVLRPMGVPSRPGNLLFLVKLYSSFIDLNNVTVRVLLVSSSCCLLVRLPVRSGF